MILGGTGARLEDLVGAYAAFNRDGLAGRVRYQARGLEELAGSRAFREALTSPGAAEHARARMDALLRGWADEAAAFRRETRPYWLYPP